MVVTCHKVIFLSDAGVAASAIEEALMQMDFWVMDASLKVTGCRVFARRDGLLSCRSAVLEELCHQAQELWKEVSKLRSIREDEKGMYGVFSEMQQLEEPWTPIAMGMQAVPTHSINISATSGEGKG